MFSCIAATVFLQLIIIGHEKYHLKTSCTFVSSCLRGSQADVCKTQFDFPFLL